MTHHRKPLATSNDLTSYEMTSPAFPTDVALPFARVTHGKPRIALVAGGLGVYWGQFEQLQPTLKNSAHVIAERLTAIGADVEDFGLLSNPVDGAATAERIRVSNSDLIVLFVSTYMTSAQVL